MITLNSNKLPCLHAGYIPYIHSCIHSFIHPYICMYVHILNTYYSLHDNLIYSTISYQPLPQATSTIPEYPASPVSVPEPHDVNGPTYLPVAIVRPWRNAAHYLSQTWIPLTHHLPTYQPTYRPYHKMKKSPALINKCRSSPTKNLAPTYYLLCIYRSKLLEKLSLCIQNVALSRSSH